jgi:hypothetical protein
MRTPVALLKFAGKALLNAVSGIGGKLDRALSPEPGDRFADVKALRQALLPFARG